MKGIDVIAAERARQRMPRDAGGEGYVAAHDRGHEDELALAAACYAIPDAYRMALPGDEVPMSWPWAGRFWKPTPDDRIRELAKAGALIAAAIDALGDAAAATGTAADALTGLLPGREPD